MAEKRGLTELLNTHHDKLNEHTAQLERIQAQLTSLEQSVRKLEEQTAKAVHEDNGLRDGLREWINNIRELM